MKYNELIKELDKGRFSNIYLFYGVDNYLRDDAVKRVTDAVLSNSNRDFNYDLLYGSSTTAEEVIGIAQTVPVFSPWRLIIVKEVDQLPDKESEALLSYISNPSPSTCLIFAGEKADMRKRFFSTLKEKALVIQFYHLFEGQIAGWIKFRAKELGFKISDEAIEILKEEVGNSLGTLDNEILKLSIYAAGKGIIEEGDVIEVVGDSRTHTIFNLTEAIGERKVEGAIKILKKIMDEGEEPPKILNMIARQIRLLHRALELKEAGFSRDEIKVRIGILARFFGAFMGQLQKHNLEELMNAFKRLQRADLDLKTSGKDRGKILESLILDLCRSGIPLQGQFISQH
ncbi:MAG: DNA polymerase III subunit delta [Nitrospirae bacterium]|nr:DNA polymerase III subunit delta [Nitrospirota bacterium]